MNPGLRYLLRKRPVRLWRRITRRSRGGKGAARIAVLILVALVILGPQLAIGMIRPPDPETLRAKYESIDRFGPLVLMVMTLAGLTAGTGLYFRRPEIDFLFPAPIGRRELLCYHIAGAQLVVLASALWISIFTLRHAATWYGGLLALPFALSFVNLFGLSARLLLSTVSIRAARGVKLALWGGVALAVAFGYAQIRMGGAAVMSTGQQFAAFADSTIARTISLPARPFVELFVADSAADIGAGIAVCVAILAALVAAILVVDVGYTEGALARSRQIEGRLRRMRSGGGTGSAFAPMKTRVRIRHAPWLGGAGPISWRQSIEIVRNIKSVLWTSLMIIGLPAIVFGFMADGPSGGVPAVLMVVMLSSMSPQQAAFDFRRELDRLPMLKSLPLAPSRVAFGYILPAMLLVAVVQALALAAIGTFVGLPDWLAPWAIAVLILPFNWVSVGIDNVLFLWFPYRMVPKEAGQPQFMGRLMAVMFGKMLSLLAVCGLAGLIGYVASPLGIGATVSAATIILVCAGLGVTALAGRAFASFDVATDLPE